MTPRSRNHSGVAAQRVCAQCLGPIADGRPLFLVGAPSGRIVGPFHAGCAEHIVVAAKYRHKAVGEHIGETYGDWPSRREETLPE